MWVPVTCIIQRAEGNNNFFLPPGSLFLGHLFNILLVLFAVVSQHKFNSRYCQLIQNLYLVSINNPVQFCWEYFSLGLCLCFQPGFPGHTYNMYSFLQWLYNIQLVFYDLRIWTSCSQLNFCGFTSTTKFSTSWLATQSYFQAYFQFP